MQDNNIRTSIGSVIGEHREGKITMDKAITEIGEIALKQYDATLGKLDKIREAIKAIIARKPDTMEDLIFELVRIYAMTLPSEDALKIGRLIVEAQLEDMKPVKKEKAIKPRKLRRALNVAAVPNPEKPGDSDNK